VLIYELSNAAVEESGLAAATVTGLVLANVPLHRSQELAEFKEQLTVLLIGMLFILLAAGIHLAEVTALGLAGVWTVAALIFVVRPIEVLLCSVGTTLSWRERLLLAWLAPRGVVAAAVASLFALRLEAFGIDGGAQLKALVFTTIGATVLWSGLTGGLIARILGLRRPSNEGWVILGGNSLVQKLAELLQTPRQRVVCIDSDPHQVRQTQSLGLRVLHGNALESSVLGRAELDTRIGAVAATENPEVNVLFVKKARGMAKEQRYLIAIRPGSTGVTQEMVHNEDAEVLFGAPTDVASWSRRLDESEAKVEWWSMRSYRPKPLFAEDGSRPPYVALARRRRKSVIPVGSRTGFRRRDAVAFLIDDTHRAQAHQQLRDAGFVPSEPPLVAATVD
ncbi:MAG: NAD-binding protein, partial [Polyangiales bacterium]